MKIHPFIFSNNPNYRLSRHAVFWFLWIVYYALMSAIVMEPKWGFGKSFFAAFVEVAETTPLDMCFCYFIIYYLFPKFLHKGRYAGMLFLWLLASLAFILFYYLNAKYIVPHIRGLFGMKLEVGSYKLYPSDFFLLFSQINMEGCVAASIKLGKLYYIKQQELDLLEQEKLKLKPDEEKAIQPAFLTDLLTRMEIIANERPLVAAQSMKKIRHLLLYILYENTSSKVPLRKEIELLQQYIDLEKLTAEKEIRVNCSVHGSFANETIAPFIILPLVENAFKQLCSYTIKDPLLNIIISVRNEEINVKLAWTKPIETSSLTNGRNVILQNISKRLKLIYPESHELKMMIETEKIFIDLNIKLKKAVN
ncbi:histidine kinase [Parafilimonas terrae]|uniref:Histidine kinase n=1 Tax=Parafilimonas terrae TaxID=1465490 RepID=A0A1I5ZAU8_9BACT|nr:histidine kinase [Parafilimonas terrae]SFQ53498.1 Histidine kinase [Parafilimonas terrae]